MYKVTWTDGWGTRQARTYHSKFFSRKPSKDEIIKAFKDICPLMSKEWFKPECSGLVFICKIEVEF